MEHLVLSGGGVTTRLLASAGIELNFAVRSRVDGLTANVSLTWITDLDKTTD